MTDRSCTFTNLAARKIMHFKMCSIADVCDCLQPAMLMDAPNQCMKVASSSVASGGRKLHADSMNSSHYISLSSENVHWGYY